MTPSVQVYETRVSHIRRTPWRSSFVHRSSMWVVDIDQPSPPAWRSFFTGAVLPRDHLSGGRSGGRAVGETLRASLQRFAEREGFDIGDGRVLLAAQPRALGFCFNPISVWWCLDSDEHVAATVVEVHNTYGDRHAYLLPGAGDRAVDGGRHRAHVQKAMYVSPFHGVDGVYEVIAPVPGDRLDLSVTLRTAEGARFSASLTGRLLESAPIWTAWASMRDALRIRVHGIRLWARRLPIQPRPHHDQESLR